MRDHLRVVLGRSPDPDEIYVEAHRPKGCIGTKKKTITSTPMWEDIAGIDLSEGGERDSSVDKSSSPHCDGDDIERISPTTHIPHHVM